MRTMVDKGQPWGSPTLTENMFGLVPMKQAKPIFLQYRDSMVSLIRVYLPVFPECPPKAASEYSVICPMAHPVS